MKSKKIHRLVVNHELPFVLIAISCHESILKTVWSINKQLNINLGESEMVVESKDIVSQQFPVYSDRESSPQLYYNLISNKSSNSVLIKELPNIDFILEISGEISKEAFANITREIKKISGVTAVLEIDPQKIKRKAAFCPI